MDEKTADLHTAAAENQIISEFEEFQQRGSLDQINAVPLRDNIFEWHFNMFPAGKKNRSNRCIHGALKFDRNPHIPPIIEILSPVISHDKIVTLNGHYHVNILEDGENDAHMSPNEILRRLAKLFEHQKFQKQVPIPACICGHDSQNVYPSKGKTYVFQTVVGVNSLMQQNVGVSNKANQFEDCMIKSVLVDYGKVYYKAQIKDMKFDTATPVRLGWGFPPDNLEHWEKQEFYGCLFGTKIDEPTQPVRGYFLHKEPWKIGLNLPRDVGFTSGDEVTVGVDFESQKFLFAVNENWVGETPFPLFMKNGSAFYPVVGVLQSSVQLIFQGPPPAVENERFAGFMSVREYMQSDRGAYWWQHGLQYHWIDFFDHGVTYDDDSSADYLEAEVKRVFEFLSAPDLRRACEVARTFRDIINRSTLLQQANLFCFYTRKRYSDSNTVLGLMLDVRKPKNSERESSLSILSVKASSDYSSVESWETGRVRHDSSMRTEYNKFLPLILNDDHGERSFRQLPKYLGEILGKGAEATVIECFDVLAALMNGCFQTVAGGFDPFLPPSAQLQEETVRLFAHLHHLMLYLATKHPQVVRYAENKCTEFSKPDIQDAAVPPLNQLGMMIAYLFVLGQSEQNWHSIRRQYVNEIWARDVPTYLSKKRDLENPGFPMNERVEQVWDVTKTSKRTFHTLVFSFFAVHFRGDDSLLDVYNSTFGSPPPQWHLELQTQCENITAKMDTWKEYFKYMGCGHPQQQRFGPMLYHGLQVAIRRGYVNSKARPGRDRSMEGPYPLNGVSPRGRGRGMRGRGGMRGAHPPRGERRPVRGRGRAYSDRDYERREVPLRHNDPNGRFGRPDRESSRGRRDGGVRGRRPVPQTRGVAPRTKSQRFGDLTAHNDIVFAAKPIATMAEFPESFQKTFTSGGVSVFLPFQREALRTITNGGCAQVIAPVGSGKTTVAAAAALYRLFSEKNAVVIMLCADNMRVTAVKEVIDGLCFEFPSIKTFEQCKGSRYMRLNEISVGRVVIVGTNGRMCDMLTRFEEIGEAVKQRLVGVFLLDADFTLHTSQINRTLQVFEHIHQSIPCSIFSNSWCAPLSRSANQLKGETEYNPIEKLPKHAAKYWFVSCENPNHRYDIFCDLIEQNPHGKCVVFCNQQRTMENIVDVVSSRVDGKSAVPCTLENAAKVAVEVSNGRYDCLVSTDYGSPAISKSGCRVIINFEVSTRDFETFTKRIGLIAPSDDGPTHVVNLILSNPSLHEYWQSLETELGISLVELGQNLRESLA